MWGPPGSGKSTICETLSHTHGLVFIMTGALLRAHVLYQTDLGKTLAPFASSASPAPDSILTKIVLERLAQVDCRERGFVLDAFPRSLPQFQALRNAGYHNFTVIMLHAPRDILETRIKYRRLDPESGLLYNLKSKSSISQEVLERLVKLDKDRMSSMSAKFAAYAKSTSDMFAPLELDRAIQIDVAKPFDVVFDDIVHQLERFNIEELRQQAKTRTVDEPRVAPPPHSLGRPGAATELGQGDSEHPASATAVMRARSGKNNVEKNGNSTVLEDPSEKGPITLIRCDGYMCERESVEGYNIAFRGAATEQVMMVWNHPPSTCLILMKRDPALIPNLIEAATYLNEQFGISVLVEPQVQTWALANGLFLDTFVSVENLNQKADFVICLGGDGLILHASTLFPAAVPPLISFNLGSLGFLAPFEYEDFRNTVNYLLSGTCNLSLRMRLTCGIIRDGVVKEKFQVLNEVVVDRGASPYLSNLDCFCDGKYITTVQADGIIMSTPTGSTAYSMSAGGSMVHPSVPAILFTPICPHSLSFRPIVFPDSAKLKLLIPEDARTHAWASFDGKSRQQLKKGDGLTVEMNMFPVPTVNRTDHTGDWFPKP